MRAAGRALPGINLGLMGYDAVSNVDELLTQGGTPSADANMANIREAYRANPNNPTWYQRLTTPTRALWGGLHAASRPITTAGQIVGAIPTTEDRLNYHDFHQIRSHLANPSIPASGPLAYDTDGKPLNAVDLMQANWDAKGPEGQKAWMSERQLHTTDLRGYTPRKFVSNGKTYTYPSMFGSEELGRQLEHTTDKFGNPNYGVPRRMLQDISLRGGMLAARPWKALFGGDGFHGDGSKSPDPPPPPLTEEQLKRRDAFRGVLSGSGGYGGPLTEAERMEIEAKYRTEFPVGQRVATPAQAPAKPMPPSSSATPAPGKFTPLGDFFNKDFKPSTSASALPTPGKVDVLGKPDKFNPLKPFKWKSPFAATA